MWEINLADQIKTFLLSIPLGMFLSAVFYVLEAFLRTDRKKGVAVWISDILFFCFAGFLSFCFLLVRTNGEIRGYAILGEIIGFYLFKVLFSKHILMFLIWILSRIKAVLGSVQRLFSNIARKMYSKIHQKMKNIGKRLKKG